MDLFRCVFISLVAFLSPLKVQSTKRSNSPKVAISYEGPCRQIDDRYLWIHCSATKTPLNDKGQCDARADGQTKGKAESRFQLKGTNYTCIQFTNRSSGEKYALKVVNQRRVVFEKHQCDADGNDPEEFRFKQECYKSGRGRLLVYKPFKNQSLCVSKDCVSQKLTLYKYNITQNGTQDTTCAKPETTPFDRLCAFRPDRIRLKTAE